MTTLLHISASPRGQRSESLAIASTFIDELPRLPTPTSRSSTGTSGTARCPNSAHRGGRQDGGLRRRRPQGDEAAAWRAARNTFERFDSADHYLFTVPMWNASVPYILKQFIDVVSQPGMVFGFDPATGTPACWTDKHAAVIYTGAVYGPDRGPAFGSDFQQSYFEDWLRWAGVDDIRNIAFRPNLATSDPEPGRRAAHARAAVVARGFLSPAGSALLAG